MLEKLKEQIERLKVYATDVDAYGDGYLKAVDSCLKTVQGYDPWTAVTPETKIEDGKYLCLDIQGNIGVFTCQENSFSIPWPTVFYTITHYMPLPPNPKS